MLKEITDKTQFNKFARHVLQSWEWGDFKIQTKTVKKVLRLGWYEENRLTNAWQVFFHKVPHLGYTIAYLPRVNTLSAPEFIETKYFCLAEKVLFMRVEPLEPWVRFYDPGFVTGRPILPVHTIHIDLTQSESEILDQMHEKTRYNIRLAEKKGVEVRQENSEEALENFIKLLSATEIRQGFYSHYPNYYRTLRKTLSHAKMIHLLSAYLPHNPRRPIASILLLHFKNWLYYPYGGSDPNFRQFMSPHLLHWEAIKLGKKLGCKTYDLWGSFRNLPQPTDPWWGIYRFKSGFGGKEVDFPLPYDLPFSLFYPFYKSLDTIRWQLLNLKRNLRF